MNLYCAFLIAVMLIVVTSHTFNGHNSEIKVIIFRRLPAYVWTLADTLFI